VRVKTPLPLLLLLLASACGDPYARYASVVHEDVDGASTDAFRMTARMQLAVVHNQIPDESLAVVAGVVTRAARDVRKRATHFATVNPPPDVAQAHDGLRAALTQVADALDSLSLVFRQCADSSRAGEAADRACEAHLNAVSTQFGYVGEDLGVARSMLQRRLLGHGVILLPRAP
jgi:hypothetical protein